MLLMYNLNKMRILLNTICRSRGIIRKEVFVNFSNLIPYKNSCIHYFDTLSDVLTMDYSNNNQIKLPTSNCSSFLFII